MRLDEIFPKKTFPLRAQATCTSPEKDNGATLTAFYQASPISIPMAMGQQISFYGQLFVLGNSGEKEIFFEFIIGDSVIELDKEGFFIGENGEFTEVTKEEFDKRHQELTEKLNLDFDSLVSLEDFEDPSISWQMIP